MKDINEYLKAKFYKLPISHTQFRATPIKRNSNGRVLLNGNKIDKKYQLQYIDFDAFYKPITSYL